MRAKYVSGSGAEGTAAVIEVGGAQYECMDCLGYAKSHACKPHDLVQVTFSAGLLRSDERGQAVIGANEERVKRLEHLGGWRYRAYGVVTRDGMEARLDCGVFDLALNLWRAGGGTTLTGEYIEVEVERLECWRTTGGR